MAKKIWKYPDEITDFVREHGHEGSIADMQQRVNERFGLDLTYQQMKTFFSNHKIHAAPRKGRKGKSCYPDGMEDFVRSIAQGMRSEELTAAVNEKYGEGTITVAHMKAYKKNHGINTGLTGRFEKGHEPQNKGKTWDEFMSPEGQKNSRRTQFKPGHTPHNGGTPVGTVRLRHDHKNRAGKPYYWVKVEQPNVWRMKHVLEWERHNGPVPDGCMVTFANGDTTDYRIDNLILETKAQHVVKNRHHIHGYDRESALAANKIADIKMAVTKAKKRKRKRGGNNMTNTKLLREKIDASGLKLNYIASQLGISPKALTMKIENQTQFKPSEIKKLCDILGIETAEEQTLIFLS